MHRLLIGVCLAAASVASAAAEQPPVHGEAPPESTAHATASAARSRLPLVLPGTREGAFTSVQGNAIDSGNNVLPRHPVRLRDARSGRIAGAQVTDASGLFTFRSLDPGTYVVELINASGAVLASSQLLNLNSGETVTAVVRLAFRMPALGGLVGGRRGPQAAAVAMAAAASGVLGATAPGAVASAVR